jgi:catechol 2,3-dioxygenase-like lactoylglutathione lyase family enzyme
VIDALDHLVLRASFVSGAVGAYETLLGRSAQNSVIRVGNVGLVIEDDASTARLSRMVFATPSLEKAERLLARRGLELTPEGTHGVPIALTERKQAPAASALLKSSEAASITELDHVVVRSANPERAVALYAGRLGLDLRLDRSSPQWNARLLFFRCGNLVVEIAHDLKMGISDVPDVLWGLSWRTPDIGRCHERLKKAGVEVSEIRPGRRPGTEVFTVQSHTANVPTIVLGGLTHF